MVKLYINSAGEIYKVGENPDKEEITIPEIVDGIKVVSLAESLFLERDDILTVKILAPIKSIPKHCFRSSGVSYVYLHKETNCICECAFYECRLEKIEGGLIKSIHGRAFYGAYIHELALGSIENIGPKVFAEATIKKGTVALIDVQNIGREAFMGCTIKNGMVLNKIKVIKKRAFLFSDIPRIEINSKKLKIETSVFEKSYLEVFKCSAEIQIISRFTFQDCYKLRFIEIASDKTLEIQDFAFQHCKSLQTPLNFPWAMNVGKEAFDGSGISVYLPETITCIGSTKHEKIYFLN